MFKHLTDFSYKRNWKEAIGFYLAYFVSIVIVAFLGGVLFAIVSSVTAFSSDSRLGTIIAVLFCFAISCLVLVQRKLYKNFGYVILTLVSAILAAFAGAILGMIIPAFMTTRGASAETQPPVAQ